MTNLGIIKDTKLSYKNDDTTLLITQDKESDLSIEFDNSSIVINYISLNSSNLNIDVKSNCNIVFNYFNFNDSNNSNFKVNVGDSSSFKFNNLVIGLNNKIKIKQDIIHENNNSLSSVVNYGIVFDNSSIDFNTSSSIVQGFKHCDVSQITKGIIIGDKASVSACPILNISEYDCKAYHGATIGKVNDDDIFYLMSRGLSKKDAFLLIVDGLIRPYIDEVSGDYKDILLDKYLNFFKG